MAIAVDATSSDSFTSSGTGSAAFNHTCSGSDRVLLVMVGCGSSISAFTVTYNGVSMTLGHSSSTDYYRGAFYLVAPATGTNSVSVSWTGNPGGQVLVHAISFTGADQTSPIDGTSTTNGGSSVASSISTTYNNTYCVDIFMDNTTETGTVSAGQTQNSQVSIASRTSGSSREQQVTAGTCSMNWTGLTAFRNAIAVGIRELQPITPLVSVSDSIAIAENLSIVVGQATFSLSVNDQLSITESVTVRNTQLGGISVSDQLSITESVTMIKIPNTLNGYSLMRVVDHPFGMDETTPDKMKNLEGTMGMDDLTIL